MSRAVALGKNRFTAVTICLKASSDEPRKNPIVEAASRNRGMRERRAKKEIAAAIHMQSSAMNPLRTRRMKAHGRDARLIIYTQTAKPMPTDAAKFLEKPAMVR